MHGKKRKGVDSKTIAESEAAEEGAGDRGAEGEATIGEEALVMVINIQDTLAVAVDETLLSLPGS